MYGVMVAFGGFAVLMTYFAIIASRNKENLVVKDYYKAEIEYQKQIDKMANTKALPSQPAVEANADGVDVFFRSDIKSFSKGFVTLYRPSNPNQDKSIPMGLSEEGRQHIPASILQPGAWVVKLDWEANGKGYYFEKPIQIPR
jgi:nitrogen fixation protein FixH